MLSDAAAASAHVTSRTIASGPLASALRIGLAQRFGCRSKRGHGAVREIVVGAGSGSSLILAGTAIFIVATMIAISSSDASDASPSESGSESADGEGAVAARILPRSNRCNERVPVVAVSSGGGARVEGGGRDACTSGSADSSIPIRIHPQRDSGTRKIAVRWHAACVPGFRMDPSRVLVVYYSRTGTTDTVARAIRHELGCEIEAIHDVKRRNGVLGYVRSGFDAALRRPTKLRAMSSEPDDYDLLIVGTPIWNRTVSAPVRTYLFANRERIRRVAFFCTHGGVGSGRVLREMQDICVQPPIATVAVRADEVRKSRFAPKIRGFVSALDAATESSEAASRAWAHDVPPIA